MKLVTIATHNERMFNIFKESAEKHGHDLVVLGFGQKWRGFTMRYELMLEYLNKIDDNEIVMHADAFDSLVLSGPDEIEKNFKKFNKPIIFGVEKFYNNFFNRWMLEKVPAKCFYKDDFIFYINGGSYIGYNKHLKNLLKILIKKSIKSNNTDDQIIINEYFSNNLDKFTLDFNYIFYLNTSYNYYKYNKTKIVNNRIIIDNIEPAIVSYPGAVFINNNKQIKKLGYSIETNNLKNIFKYISIRIDLIYDVLKKFKLEILVIIMITIIIILKK